MWNGPRARGSGCGSPRRGADEHIAAMVAELPLHFAAADKLQFKSNVGSGEVFGALSENLTERPLLRNFLHPLNREELDVGHRHPLGLQQQIPQVLIPPAAV